jgi:hypothetical protein
MFVWKVTRRKHADFTSETDGDEVTTIAARNDSDDGGVVFGVEPDTDIHHFPLPASRATRFNSLTTSPCHFSAWFFQADSPHSQTRSYSFEPFGAASVTNFQNLSKPSGASGFVAAAGRRCRRRGL